MILNMVEPRIRPKKRSQGSRGFFFPEFFGGSVRESHRKSEDIRGFAEDIRRISVIFEDKPTKNEEKNIQSRDKTGTSFRVEFEVVHVSN